jgi:hypothetical protein
MRASDEDFKPGASDGFEACTSATRALGELRAPHAMKLICPEDLNSWARAFQSTSVTMFCGGAGKLGVSLLSRKTQVTGYELWTVPCHGMRLQAIRLPDCVLRETDSVRAQNHSSRRTVGFLRLMRWKTSPSSVRISASLTKKFSHLSSAELKSPLLACSSCVRVFPAASAARPCIRTCEGDVCSR